MPDAKLPDLPTDDRNRGQARNRDYRSWSPEAVVAAISQHAPESSQTVTEGTGAGIEQETGTSNVNLILTDRDEFELNENTDPVAIEHQDLTDANDNPILLDRRSLLEDYEVTLSTPTGADDPIFAVHNGHNKF